MQINKISSILEGLDIEFNSIMYNIYYIQKYFYL